LCVLAAELAYVVVLQPIQVADYFPYSCTYVLVVIDCKCYMSLRSACGELVWEGSSLARERVCIVALL
jgi:hypothetical protein